METEFHLPIDAAKFRSTSDSWHNLMLHAPWSVGSVDTLIELKTFTVKEDWEAFYYQSGQEREVLISRWDPATQDTLQDESLIRTDRRAIQSLNWNLKNLNTQFGRTQENLFRKGQILYDDVKGKSYNLSVEDCFECVRYRVICETWNRMQQRKRDTISSLREMFPQVEFRQVESGIRHTYAIDYEAYQGGDLLYALHLKHEPYTGSETIVLNARHANIRKNQLYKTRFGAPVYNIISDYHGNIINREVLE